MPVIAIVNRSRFREKSGGCLLWGPCGCLLSAALTSLLDKFHKLGTMEKIFKSRY